MSTFSEAQHPVKGEVSSAGYPHGELTATGSPRFGFDFGRLSILPVPATVIQTKLGINTPGDEYEQEADRVSTPYADAYLFADGRYPERRPRLPGGKTLIVAVNRLAVLTSGGFRINSNEISNGINDTAASPRESTSAHEPQPAP